MNVFQIERIGVKATFAERSLARMRSDLDMVSESDCLIIFEKLLKKERTLCGRLRMRILA